MGTGRGSGGEARRGHAWRGVCTRFRARPRAGFAQFLCEVSCRLRAGFVAHHGEEVVEGEGARVQKAMAQGAAEVAGEVATAKQLDERLAQRIEPPHTDGLVGLVSLVRGTVHGRVRRLPKEMSELARRDTAEIATLGRGPCTRIPLGRLGGFVGPLRDLAGRDRGQLRAGGGESRRASRRPAGGERPAHVALAGCRGCRRRGRRCAAPTPLRRQP